MKCNICGTEFEGEKCPDCGAPALDEAFTLNEQAALKPKKTKVRKPIYKKWWFWTVVAVILIGSYGNIKDTPGTATVDTSVLSGTPADSEIVTPADTSVLSGDITDTPGVTPADTPISTGQTEENKEKDTVIKSINSFKAKKYSLLTGESVELSARIDPKGVSKEDVVIISSDPAIVGISDVTLSDSGIYTEIKIKCNALVPGTSIVKITSADGKISSDELTFTVEQAPVIKTISNLSPGFKSCEVGDTSKFTVYMTPAGITKEDFTITGTDSSVVGISDVQINDDGDKTVLTFTVRAIKAGSAEIALISSDGKTKSNEVSFTVKTKDTSRTVYVTPYGEKYHFSSTCAGKNATPTTLDKAKATGKGACAKCTY